MTLGADEGVTIRDKGTIEGNEYSSCGQDDLNVSLELITINAGRDHFSFHHFYSIKVLFISTISPADIEFLTVSTKHTNVKGCFNMLLACCITVFSHEAQLFHPLRRHGGFTLVMFKHLSMLT